MRAMTESTLERGARLAGLERSLPEEPYDGWWLPKTSTDGRTEQAFIAGNSSALLPYINSLLMRKLRDEYVVATVQEDDQGWYVEIEDFRGSRAQGAFCKTQTDIAHVLCITLEGK